MRVAEVPASSFDDFADDGSFASSLAAGELGAAIGFVMFLELSSLSLEVSIVRHRVSTEIDSFLQSFFHGFKHGIDILFGNGAEMGFRMDARSPEDFIRIDVADACNELLVHESGLYRRFGTKHKPLFEFFDIE